MDIYKLKFTMLQQEIISFLCIYAGQSFSGRRLARHLNVSPTAVSKAIKQVIPQRIAAIEADI